MKRNPNLPPPDREEALIQELEALLDQENPDEARLHALLDQLDRRTGGAPLDPAEGWADLQRRRAPRPRRRWGRLPVAVAAVVVCLAVSVAALGDHWGLHDKFADYFGITQETAPLLQETGTLPNCAVTRNGATVTIRQTVADANGVYVLYELETPETVSLTERYFYWRGGADLSLSTDGAEVNLSLTGGQLEVLDDHHALFLASIQSDRQDIQPGELTLVLRDLGYFTTDPQHPDETRFVPVLEGTWKLSWALTAVEPGRDLALAQPVVWQGVTYPFDRLTLTPLSLAVFGTYDAEPADGTAETFPREGYPPLALVFRDGTRLDLGAWGEEGETAKAYHAGGAFNGTNYDVRIYVQFAEILDPAQITAIQIGDQTYPLAG